VIRVLARRVRTFAALVEDLSLRDVTQRTARCLLRESDRAGATSFVLPDTQDVLAAQIGTVREQVSRALSQFRRDGVIELRGRRLRIVDPRRLKTLAGDGP
jgi:CRP/FNR family transcriptional regulator, dissimilatory nitrate respiration regulator